MKNRLQLLTAIQLPKNQLAIIDTRTFQIDTMEAKGNQLADAAAKHAALNTHAIKP